MMLIQGDNVRPIYITVLCYFIKNNIQLKPGNIFHLLRSLEERICWTNINETAAHQHK